MSSALNYEGHDILLLGDFVCLCALLCGNELARWRNSAWEYSWVYMPKHYLTPSLSTSRWSGPSQTSNSTSKCTLHLVIYLHPQCGCRNQVMPPLAPPHHTGSDTVHPQQPARAPQFITSSGPLRFSSLHWFPCSLWLRANSLTWHSDCGTALAPVQTQLMSAITFPTWGNTHPAAWNTLPFHHQDWA